MSYRIIQTDDVRCAPQWSWISDQNGWRGYHLWHVTSGQATINKKETIYKLSPGDCFFFDLADNHVCAHDPENPLNVEAIYWHPEKPINPEVFHVKNNNALCTAIHQCIILHRSQHADASLKWLEAAVSEFINPLVENHKLYNRDIDKLCKWLNANCQFNFSLDALCAKAGYSKNHIIRLFRQQTGMTPNQYYTQCRIRKSISMLLYTNYTITEIAQLSGYNDIAYFSSTFKKITGYTPKQFRARETSKDTRHKNKSKRD